MGTTLDSMKQTIQSQALTINDLSMQLGFAKGQARLYEQTLQENIDLRRQLEDEQKIRKIMRDAMTEHTETRDAVMADFGKTFFPNEKAPFKDMYEMASKCLLKYTGLKQQVEKLQKNLDSVKRQNLNPNLQDYVVETVDGRTIGYKAKDAMNARHLAVNDGYRPNKIMTKEEYEIKKFL